MKYLFAALSLLMINLSLAQEGRFITSLVGYENSLNTPWEVIYGPDSMLWITERAARRVVRIHPNTAERDELVSISEAYQASTQDGLLGMALHPDLGKGLGSDFVYLAYTYQSEGRKVKLVRYTYTISDTDGSLSDPLDILIGLPGSNDHNSGRLLFGPDNTLYYAIGDQGKNQYENVCKTIMAQALPTQVEMNSLDWSSYQGKILRINLDGSIPEDNPVMDGVKSHIYTYGHRNAQGLAFSENGLLFSAEHGPKTDDELNLLIPGKNYGWPFVAGYQDDKSYTYCQWATSANCGSFNDYGCPSDAQTSRESDWSHPDFTPPVYTFYTVENGYEFNDEKCGGSFICWPTIAPSSMDYYDMEGAIPGWGKALLLVGLKRGRIYYVPIDEAGQVTGDPVEYWYGQNRYRDIAIHPNGRTFYIITDNSGQTSGPSNGNTTTLENPGSILKVEYDDTPLVDPLSFSERKSDYFTVFPNPAVDKVCLEFSLPLQPFPKDVRILNVQGAEVLTKSQVSTETELDVSGLKSGLYFVQISVEGIVLTKRLTIAR